MHTFYVRTTGLKGQPSLCEEHWGRVCCPSLRSSYGHRRRGAGVLLELEEERSERPPVTVLRDGRRTKVGVLDRPRHQVRAQLMMVGFQVCHAVSRVQAEAGPEKELHKMFTREHLRPGVIGNVHTIRSNTRGDLKLTIRMNRCLFRISPTEEEEEGSEKCLQLQRPWTMVTPGTITTTSSNNSPTTNRTSFTEGLLLLLRIDTK